MNTKKWMLGLALIMVLSLTAVPGCAVAETLLMQTAHANVPATTAQLTPTQAPMETAPAITSDAAAAVEGTLEEIYQDVSPSVVYIEVLQKQPIGMESMLPFFFGNPSPQQSPEEQYQRGSGSGFVWDKQGHIVTNNHVVDGADKIKVKFADGTIAEGTVIGTDRDSDLAVVQIDLPADQLRPIQLADSRQVKVGQLAVAIGNPFGLENTMTVGIVSALGRSLPVESDGGMGPSYTIPDVIQTDAPINPGNSGGVLMNDQGQVIGVTAAIASPVQASAGVGFAIPSVIVQKVVPVLIEEGHYEHAWLGISGTTMNPDLAQAMKLEADQRGALIVDTVPDGPADEAGLRGSEQTVTIDGEEQRVGGDVVVAIDGRSVETFDDLTTYLARSTEAGQQITLAILRNGSKQQVSLALGERPSAEEEEPAADVTTAGRAWLGITGLTLSPELAQAMDLPEDQQGVLISEVVSGGPAEKAGLHGSHKPVTIGGQRLIVGGDIIVAWNDRPVTQMEELRALVGEASTRQEVTLRVLRDGTEIEFRVTLESPNSG